MSRLIDHFPSWMTAGAIFTGMTGMPWNDEDSGIDPLYMDIEYIGQHSGLKQSGPLVEKMTKFPDDVELTSTEIGILQTIIKQKFNANWQRVYDALLVEYAPLDNYNMEEKTTPGIVRKTATETSSSISNSASGSVYGFNSDAAVPASSSSGSSTTTGNKANNYVEESATGFDKLERHGNIGVTTSAQMLSGELEVRRNMFLEIVYADVDTILTRPSW